MNQGLLRGVRVWSPPGMLDILFISSSLIGHPTKKCGLYQVVLTEVSHDFTLYLQENADTTP
jgi:hypothetical protein